jgi:hypothetical protein
LLVLIEAIIAEEAAAAVAAIGDVSPADEVECGIVLID